MLIKLGVTKEYYLLIANNVVVGKTNLTWSINKHWSRENGVGERSCYNENITGIRELLSFLWCLSALPLWCPLLRVIVQTFQGTALGWWGDPFLLCFNLLVLTGVYPSPSTHPSAWHPAEVCKLPQHLRGLLVLPQGWPGEDQAFSSPSFAGAYVSRGRNIISALLNIYRQSQTQLEPWRDPTSAEIWCLWLCTMSMVSY